MKEKLLKMMKDMLEGNYDYWEFSFDFPDELFEADEHLNTILDEAPTICANYEPDKTSDPDDKWLLNTEEFRVEIEKLYEILLKAD